MAGVDDFLLSHLGVGDVIDQCPSDATAGTRVDETILRTGVEGIFSIDELRVQHHVALLAAAFQVRQALPVDQILGAGDSSRGGSGGEVAW